MPRLAKVVDVLAVRYVKQGTETARFRTDSTSHSCQYVCMYKPLDLNMSTFATLKPILGLM